MQDISRKGTRWTFEDNKEENIKDGTMHSTQYIQLNGIWSIETTLQWVVVNRKTITVSCDDYERPIKWVVVNWSGQYSPKNCTSAPTCLEVAQKCSKLLRRSPKLLRKCPNLCESAQNCCESAQNCCESAQNCCESAQIDAKVPTNCKSGEHLCKSA